MLEADGGDGAAIEQQHGVEQLAVAPPWRPHQHRRPAVGGVLGQRPHGGLDTVLEGRFEDQVLRWVAGRHQLAADDQVGAGGLATGGADKTGVAVDVADGRVQLRQGYGQGLGHGNMVRIADGFTTERT